MKIADKIVARLREALRAAPLDGATIHETPGEPTLIQVTRPGASADALPAMVVSITVRGAEAAVPPPKQPRLFEERPATPRAARAAAPAMEAPREAVVAAPKAEEPPAAPAAPSGVHTFKALGLTVVESAAPLAALRAAVPHASWRPIGLERYSAILGAEDLATLRKAFIERRPPFVRESPFGPDAAPGLVIEIDGGDPVHAELAAQLAAQLAPGGRPTTATRRASTVIELPRSTDESALAWALAYLVENRAPWWIREQAARKLGAKKGRAA